MDGEQFDGIDSAHGDQARQTVQDGGLPEVFIRSEFADDRELMALRVLPLPYRALSRNRQSMSDLACSNELRV